MVLFRSSGWCTFKGKHAPSPMHLQRALFFSRKHAKESPAAEKDGDAEAAVESSETDTSLARVSVPDFYPEVIAVPINRRPVFPGFYKTVTINSPAVAKAVTLALKKGRPYIGLFLSKNDELGTGSKVVKDDGAGVKAGPLKSLEDIYPVGVFAQVINVVPTPTVAEDEDGDILFPPKITPSLTAIVYPHRRIHATSLMTQSDSAVARVMTENMYDEPFDRKDQTVRAITQEIFAALADVAKLNAFFREHIAHHNVPSAVFENPSRLADFVAVLSSADSSELQELLAETRVEERLRKALFLLKKELVTAQLQHSIAKDVEQKLTQKQREYFLHEQLKAIKKELGLEADSRDKIIQMFEKRAELLEMPPAVKSVFDEEMAKLSVLEPAGSEFSVTRNYLDWLTTLPWGKRSEESLDIAAAAAILDEDHYGMEDVKQRILEFIAVSRLRGNVCGKGKILCLVGPPGVGKTSIGRSIARALGRKYFRFSVGGLTDVAEIKGHRRTYVGAMPGKVVQALKSIQTENPLILIDEIDKLGRGVQGDPASALLELLDPEQNSAFLDHYLDTPLDLSNVLFMCTANTADTIPAPLLDRMEVINLSGYVSSEKMHIAQNYLIPAAVESTGLEKCHVTISPDALETLIRFYCRESGVRNLKKHIEKIYRKAALKIVKSAKVESSQTVQSENSKTDSQVDKEPLDMNNVKRLSRHVPSVVSDITIADQVINGCNDQSGMSKNTSGIVIDTSNLKEFVGSPAYTSDRLYDEKSLPPGVVTGLAWTSNGGCILYVETIAENLPKGDEKKRSGLIHTGQMGDVMKESTSIAYSYAKAFVASRYPDNHFFETSALHLHVPEGATPKDGPSAGCTMASSLVSLALGKSLPSDVAMTGELTLTGKILRIGGVREKTVAASRAGINTVILPKSNESDWNELPDHIKQGITPQFVSTFEDLARVLQLL